WNSIHPCLRFSILRNVGFHFFRPASSAGSVGDSYDNALAETINGLYKAELVHRRSWRTLQDLELATLEWVHWYNHRRLLGPLGYVSPAEAEEAYNRNLVLSARAA
ncbi:integrase core domain-containing protein, partial [Burkholderia cepacia]|uniref:integrase core domain-containing protein n=1 Tax=Burkholderia cepacia TaxID=292 RepID=UPI001E42391B